MPPELPRAMSKMGGRMSGMSPGGSGTSGSQWKTQVLSGTNQDSRLDSLGIQAHGSWELRTSGTQWKSRLFQKPIGVINGAASLACPLAAQESQELHGEQSFYQEPVKIPD